VTPDAVRVRKIILQCNRRPRREDAIAEASGGVQDAAAEG
jgi:hypothetical protein